MFGLAECVLLLQVQNVVFGIEFVRVDLVSYIFSLRRMADAVVDILGSF